MTSRTTDDYLAMSAAGIAPSSSTAFWLGQPRTHVGSFEDYFLSLLGWERFRASQFGIRHFCTMGLNPKEANDEKLASGVLELLPPTSKGGRGAVGEIGYDDMTPTEEKYLVAQLQLALEHDLPALIHTPHRDKKRGTQRTLDVLRDLSFPPERVLVDHNNEETIRATLDAGVWAGHSIYPETKMDERRMVEIVRNYGAERVIINSAADWGVSDPLKVPKTAALMQASGIAPSDIERICWDNPVAFFAQSGRLDLTGIPVDQRALFEGNSVLRGQAPRVDL